MQRPLGVELRVRLLDGGDEGILVFLWYKDVVGGDAELPGVDLPAPQRALGGELDVGVLGVDEDGGLAACSRGT